MDRHFSYERADSAENGGALVVVARQVTCAGFAAHSILLKRNNKKTIRSDCS